MVINIRCNAFSQLFPPARKQLHNMLTIGVWEENRHLMIL